MINQESWGYTPFAGQTESISPMLHVWCIRVYLPTFGGFLGHMLLDIPYKDQYQYGTETEATI